MATAIHEAGSKAASIAAPPAVPGLDPTMRRVIDTTYRTGAESMRCQVLRILSRELDSVTALRIAELVMQVKA